jgi:polar amino acid transport system substrate-binding protein
MRFAITLTIIFMNLPLWAQPTLRFVTEELPPFNYSDNQIIIGFFPDMIESVCLEANIACVITMQTWLDNEWLVRNAKADAIFAIAYNKKRDNWLTYGPPIVQTEYGLFVRAADPFVYQGPQSLQGQTLKIGAYGPSHTFYSLQQLLIDAPNLGVIRFSTTLDALIALNQGEIDAVHSNHDSVVAWVAQYQLPSVRYAGAVTQLHYHYAFGDHVDKKLMGKFNMTYDRLKKEGKIALIAKKYNVELVD